MKKKDLIPKIERLIRRKYYNILEYLFDDNPEKCGLSVEIEVLIIKYVRNELTQEDGRRLSKWIRKKGNWKIFEEKSKEYEDDIEFQEIIKEMEILNKKNVT